MKYIKFLLFILSIFVIPYALAQDTAKRSLTSPCTGAQVSYSGTILCIPPDSIIILPPGLKQLLSEIRIERESGLRELMNGNFEKGLEHINNARNLSYEYTALILNLKSPLLTGTMQTENTH